MKKLISASLFSLLIFAFAKAQNAQNEFIPKNKRNVSNEDYLRAIGLLKSNYQNIRENQGKVNYANYWNKAFAYATMKYDKDSIFDNLTKSRNLNNESFCYIANAQLKNTHYKQLKFYKMLGDAYLPFLKSCEGIEFNRTTLEERWKEKKQLNLTGFNESVIDKLIVLMDKDQYYRFDTTWDERQRQLDSEVQVALTKILNTFGYPGKSMVGESYMNYACLMIEHGGDLEYQEKYLPMVTEALKEGEVEKNYVRMLIDRIHWKKTDKQIFGSQNGVPFDTEEVIREFKVKYNL